MKKEIKIIEILKEFYPDAKCSLDFETPFQIMVAVVLSAQCTDARVNLVTPSIFKKYPEAKDFANMDISLLEELIHPCGFYKNKAKNIKAAAVKIVNEYNGILPNTMEELINLPGVGRKSANVIMLEAFNNPQGIAIDTHAKRISNRIGFSSKSDPLQIEQDLLKIFPKKYFYDVNHLLVWHGRHLCTARKPNCLNCPINKYCKYFIKETNNNKINYFKTCF